MIFKIDVLKDFKIFSGKNLCWSLYLITLQALWSATSLERDSSTDFFVVNMANFQEQLFYRTPLVAAC